MILESGGETEQNFLLGRAPKNLEYVSNGLKFAKASSPSRPQSTWQITFRIAHLLKIKQLPDYTAGNRLL